MKSFFSGIRSSWSSASNDPLRATVSAPESSIQSLATQTSATQTFARSASAASRGTAQGRPWLTNLFHSALDNKNSIHRDLPKQQWHQWATTEVGPQEDRRTALKRLRAYIHAGNFEAQLDWSGLGLTSFPDPMPTMVVDLDVSNNALKEWPAQFSPNLKRLNASGNFFTTVSSQFFPSLEALDLSRNMITHLPEIIAAPRLRQLNLWRNLLKRLSDALPTQLEELNVSNNCLSQLPCRLPPKLIVLKADHNELATLPDYLPADLNELHLHNNQLEKPPLQALPKLQKLKLSRNKFTSFSNTTLSNFASDCEIDLRRNPLKPIDLEILDRSIENDQGLTIWLPTETDKFPPRPLHYAIADWHEVNEAEVKQTWQAFAKEENAGLFSRFLDRLLDTVNYKHQTFRDKVLNWLQYLTEHSALRSSTFFLSREADENCEDKISNVFSDMGKLRITFDVERGLYDHRLDELIEIGRAMYRFELLAYIARDHYNVLLRQWIRKGRLPEDEPDETEINLAFQLQLKEQLALPTDLMQMRFFDISKVSQDDLNHAEKTVKEFENAYFKEFLVTQWEPWQAALQRLDKSAYAEAQTALSNRMEKEFEGLVAEQLEKNLAANQYTPLNLVGVNVGNELKWETHYELTNQFLEKRDLSSLLEKRWIE